TLSESNISARVINMASIKPIDAEAIIKAAAETGAIVTAEEHNIIGGLGSAVSEVVASNKPVPMEFVG
ncbi:Transketolase central region, partial [human gut metagenome]